MHKCALIPNKILSTQNNIFSTDFFQTQEMMKSDGQNDGWMNKGNLHVFVILWQEQKMLGDHCQSVSTIHVHVSSISLLHGINYNVLTQRNKHQ